MHDPRFTILTDYFLSPEARAAGEMSVAEGPARIRCADHAASHYLHAQRAGRIPRDREAFALLLLDAKHGALALHVCSIGTLNSAPVHPREVFRPAIAIGAKALVLAHHHPSGDHNPSAEDRQVTERLTEVGTLVGIEVLDHVVIGFSRFFSFADGRHHPNPSIR